MVRGGGGEGVFGVQLTLLMVTATILPAASYMRVRQPSMRSVTAPPNQDFCTLKWNSEALILVLPAPSDMIIAACTHLLDAFHSSDEAPVL